ncbi:MAG: hypothetical protein GY910_21285, partial [bacterium]|nr:hypothetical protein [bacterium]
NDAGQGAAAVEVFDAAVEHARDHGWRELFVRAAFGRGGHSPYRSLLDRGTLALLAEIEEFDDLDALTRARVRARTAALQLNWQRYSDREAMSGEALASGRAAGASRHELLEILEARWIAIGCPRGAGLIDAVDVELEALRKELGALAYDAGMRETAALWFARGDVVRYEAAHYLDPAGSRREIDSWRHDGLNGTVACFEGRLEEAAECFDEAGLRGSNCWGDSGPVLHGLAHLFVDAMAGTTRSEPLMADVAA